MLLLCFYVFLLVHCFCRAFSFLFFCQLKSGVCVCVSTYYVCTCVCIYARVYVLFLLLATRLSFQHFNKKNVVEYNLYIQTVHMFWCCHIISVDNEMHLHVIQVTSLLYYRKTQNSYLQVYFPLSLFQSATVCTSTCLICFISDRISSDVCVFK
jgi:hypothetical protein